MERIYSEDFILDCANPVKAANCQTLQLIRNGLKRRDLEISVLGEALTLVELEQLRNGTEIDSLVFKTIMEWIQARVLQPTLLEPVDLPQHPSSDVSSTWLKDEYTEAKLIDFLEQQQLLSLIEQDILSDDFKWLFSITELPTIGKGAHFIWREYLEPFTHFTDRILLWDRYFLYSWNRSIEELLGGYLEKNPNLELEIVSEFESTNASYKNANRTVQSIRGLFGDRVRFNRLSKEGGKVFHDRYLATKYCLIKAEPGFAIINPRSKSFRQTTPTLVGRYAEGNHKWKTVHQNWSTWIDTYCSLIE